ncbi:MAG TPA: hypothetical protein VE084_14345, partial [Burkholderiaceae bacterium]|nr:hypothetical protein [Burkholderiaceae bacterium]
VRITDTADIDKLRALQAAGQVRAQIPPARQGLGGHEEQAPAVVFEITRLGMMAVQAFRPPAHDPASWSPGMPLPAAQPAFQASLR